MRASSSFNGMIALATKLLILMLVVIQHSQALTIVDTAVFRPHAMSKTRIGSFCSTRSCAHPQQQHQQPNDSELQRNRRRVLFQQFALLISASVVALPETASASYSAYTHREQDWDNRLKQGTVQVSSKQDLKRQLLEVAPANAHGRQLFCPNGPSAAVSPLMENKCGDKMALPSVYGRTEDVVGNSIPGFAEGYGKGPRVGYTAAEIGGFPEYGKTITKTDR
jgi:hypothetical protein